MNHLDRTAVRGHIIDAVLAAHAKKAEGPPPERREAALRNGTAGGISPLRSHTPQKKDCCLGAPMPRLRAIRQAPTLDRRPLRPGGRFRPFVGPGPRRPGGKGERYDRSRLFPRIAGSGDRNQFEP
ncbi:MAG: hypothetical protein V8Q84_05725 [Bilophila sp.]